MMNKSVTYRLKADMHDLAKLDRRSVYAGLHGYGDNRVKLWEDFYQHAKQENPAAEDDEITKMYQMYCEAGRLTPKAMDKKEMPDGVQLLRVLAVDLLMGALIAIVLTWLGI